MRKRFDDSHLGNHLAAAVPAGDQVFSVVVTPSKLLRGEAASGGGHLDFPRSAFSSNPAVSVVKQESSCHLKTESS